MKITRYILLIILTGFVFSFFGVVLKYYYLNSKNMADPVWGQLTKSQTDNETIEQAIARLITTHEADAGAHTGIGESLETHKAQDIIDHKADSIVPDKFSSNETLLETIFESISSWLTQGTITNGLTNLTVTQYGNDGADKYVSNEEIGFAEEDVGFTILNNLWQADFDYADNFAVANFAFGIGVLDSYIPSNLCLCWKIENGVLYSGWGNDVIVVWVSHGAIVENTRYTVRVTTEKVMQEAYFYLNGVLVRTVDLTGVPDPYYVNWGVATMKIGGTVNSQFAKMRFWYLRWSAERQ